MCPAVIDGSDPFTTLSAFYAANLIAQQYTIDLALQDLSQSGPAISSQQLNPFTPHLQVFYNPDLKDLWFLIPGTIALLLQTQSTALTTLAVVREREIGTIEQILVTPIRPVELMLGKTIPNLFFCMFSMLMILAISLFGFRVPFNGDFGLFFVLALLYSVSGLGLGLLISSVSQNQRQAMTLTLMVTFVSVFLGGFVFPQYTMPLIPRVLSYVFPLTYFIPIARGIISKGVGFEALWGYIWPLSVSIVVILFLAARLFRSKLD